MSIYKQIRDFDPVMNNHFTGLSLASNVLDLPERSTYLMGRLKSLVWSKKIDINKMSMVFSVDGARPRDKMKDSIVLKDIHEFSVYIVWVRGPKCGVYNYDDKFRNSVSAGPDGKDHWSTVLQYFMEEQL